MKLGDVPDSVQGTEQPSIAICRPLVRSVSSSELVVAVVVKVIVDKFIVPELMRSTLRCTVSPGPIPDALTLRRFVDAPVAPS